jgi:hypothetical protein
VLIKYRKGYEATPVFLPHDNNCSLNYNLENDLGKYREKK